MEVAASPVIANDGPVIVSASPVIARSEATKQSHFVAGLRIEDLGLLDYATAYRKQQELVAQKKIDPSTSDTLIFVEHPDVYTFGRKSDYLPVHLPNAVQIERGGEATFHNPGQLVCYPILQLQEDERDVGAFLRNLEQALIDTLNTFGISSETRKGATGVWIQGKEKKIASIGVAFSSWVSFHGVALNVRNDLSGFGRINPCGFEASVMTSMFEILQGACPTLEEVKKILSRNLAKRFHRILNP